MPNNNFTEHSRKFFEKFLNNNIKQNYIRIWNVDQLSYNDIKEDIDIYINKIKQILSITETKTEDINIEAIAYYKSYHENSDFFGIYFNMGKFAEFIVNSYKKFNGETRFSKVRNICFESILYHEIFHYLVELYITQYEVINEDFSCFDRYSNNFYRINNSLNKDCLEEGLADYFAKMYLEHNIYKQDSQIITNILTSNLPPYNQFKNINDNNYKEKFLEFEMQILNNFIVDSSKFSSINNNKRIYNNDIFINFSFALYGLYRTIDNIVNKNQNPLFNFEFNKQINIPVYIVNDDLSKETFDELVSLIFPNI